MKHHGATVRVQLSDGTTLKFEHLTDEQARRVCHSMPAGPSIRKTLIRPEAIARAFATPRPW